MLFQVTMANREAAERACKDPNPIIDGRKANVNLAYLGAKPRGIQTGTFTGTDNFLATIFKTVCLVILTRIITTKLYDHNGLHEFFFYGFCNFIYFSRSNDLLCQDILIWKSL